MPTLRYLDSTYFRINQDTRSFTDWSWEEIEDTILELPEWHRRSMLQHLHRVARDIGLRLPFDGNANTFKALRAIHFNIRAYADANNIAKQDPSPALHLVIS